MATLVLTAVGSVVGGPIGGAIGAVIGQSIDARLFAPKARHGPRLGELAVQTSSYGSAIPKLFGTVRVAGTVIWSTDLQEQRSSSGGGKGRPKTVNYSYSASFAVALSARPIRAVRRIWADGKLLRGAAGDFKTETKFRLHPGGDDQEADPLIASAEGVDGTPTYRGLAYAMFEDFQLADYGNRIPSLSFEVEADAGAVAVAAIAEELSGRAVATGDSPSLLGYAASGDSVRGALEELTAFLPLSLTDEAGTLRLGSAFGEPVLLDPGNGARTPAGAARDEHVRQAAATTPNSVTLAYSDPALDYQTGLQRAFRGGAALVTEQRALPITIGAADAKRFAQARLAGLWAGRAGASVHRSWRSAELRPGQVVRLAGKTGLWRIERWLLEDMVVRLQLVGVPGAGAAVASANPGRPVSEADLRHGPTAVRLIELPAFGEQVADRAQLLVAAAGVEPGWRRAALMVSFDGGVGWQELGATAAPAVLGTAQSVLAPGESALLDERASCVVGLLNDDMMLESRTDLALAGGANLALIGEELVQFGMAEALGGGRFRLSRLLRGRFGTEWATGAHQIGEGFLLIDRATLVPIDVPAGAIGGEAQLVASGIDDGSDGVTAVRQVSGEALRPPAPVHLRARREASGDISLRWVPRSRAGWAWRDGGDAPLAEESERYEVTIIGPSFTRRTEVSAPALLYSAAEQAMDGAAGEVNVSVVQIGTHARSRPAMIGINI
jgi:hypothetical protein